MSACGCLGLAWCEQVRTGLQWWPPDFTSRGSCGPTSGGGRARTNGGIVKWGPMGGKDIYLLIVLGDKGWTMDSYIIITVYLHKTSVTPSHLNITQWSPQWSLNENLTDINAYSSTANLLYFQHEYRCSCGHTYGRYGRHGIQSTCENPCLGDGLGTCGANLVNAVYDLGRFGINATVPCSRGITKHAHLQWYWCLVAKFCMEMQIMIWFIDICLLDENCIQY